MSSQPPSPPPPADSSEINRSPHVVIVKKNHMGFGFNVRGQVGEGGTFRPINGELYGPMQYVSAVLEDGPAEEGGLRYGDRIIEINGESAEGVKHGAVVEMIRRTRSELRLLVISVTPEEASHLEMDSSSARSSASVDNFERRALPITIPDTKQMTGNDGLSYTVYNICLSNRHIVSRRYSEFDTLLNKLKVAFPDFNFPSLPMKWPFQLSHQRIDQRRRALEDWLDVVCSIRAICESDLVMEFLQQGKHAKTPSPSEKAKEKVNIRVALPTEATVTVSIELSATTPTVLKAVCRQAGLGTESQKLFGLFEVITEGHFYRHIRGNEFPHSIYVSKHPSQTSTPLFLRRWLFSPFKVLTVQADKKAIEFFFLLAVEDVKLGLIEVGEAAGRLKKLHASDRQLEYLDTVKHLPNYCTQSFPACKCDNRKTGKIQLTFQRDSLLVKACNDDGEPEGQETTFAWSMIKRYEADIEEEAFIFQYDRYGKEKWMRVYSDQFEFMNDCVDRIMAELAWPVQIPKIPTPPPSPTDSQKKTQPSRSDAAAKPKRKPKPKAVEEDSVQKEEPASDDDL